MQVLPSGLHTLECDLFVGAPSPARLDFRVDYRLEGTQFPDLNARQILGAGAVVSKPGERLPLGEGCASPHLGRLLSIQLTGIVEANDKTCCVQTIMTACRDRGSHDHRVAMSSSKLHVWCWC